MLQQFFCVDVSVQLKMCMPPVSRLCHPSKAGPQPQTGGLHELFTWAGGHPSHRATHCFPGDGFCGGKGGRRQSGAGGQEARGPEQYVEY